MPVASLFGKPYKIVIKSTGQILDVFEDETLKLSNNIIELSDVAEVPATFIKEINLPGTRKNIDIFEHYYEISVENPEIFNTNTKVEAYIDFDGLYIIDGYIQLNKVLLYQNKFVDSISISLFGIISNFSVDAKLKYLTDLGGLSRYNHTASLHNVSESWNGRLFTGDVIYPLAEYGQQMRVDYSSISSISNPDYGVLVQHFKPAIKAKVVWDEIFKELGYQYTGSFFNSNVLDEVYLLCNNKFETAIYDEDLTVYGEGQVKANGNIGDLFDITVPINTYVPIPADYIVSDPTNKFDLSAQYVKYTLDVPSTLEAQIDLSFEIANIVGTNNGIPQFTVGIFDDTSDTLVASVDLDDLNDYLVVKKMSVQTTVAEKLFYSVKFITPELAAGKYRIKIKFTIFGDYNFTLKLNPPQKNGSGFSVIKVRQSADNRVMDIPRNMPYGNSGITLLDFVRGIQKKFNLIIYADKRNPNSVIVDTFNEWYNSGVVSNFNEYIKLNEKIEFTPANSLTYKKIKFKDNTDSDYITTLFNRLNNRTYGEAVYYDSGSYFNSGEWNVETIFGNGPLIQISGSGYSGSYAQSVNRCNSYLVTNRDAVNDGTLEYVPCGDSVAIEEVISAGSTLTICVNGTPFNASSGVIFRLEGDCSVIGQYFINETGFPIYVPTFVADDKFSPAQVSPRLYYYNGQLNAPTYYFCGYSGSLISREMTTYPYFDAYGRSNADQLPHTGSLSLLFNNEVPSLGATPTGSLVTQYYNKYIEMLYNPKTRLVAASAVIPLADYFDLELNDLAFFKNNYYHIRAINDYDIKTGECTVQLLGPILYDTLSSMIRKGGFTPILPPPGPTTTTTSTTTSTTTIPSTTTTTTTTTSTTTTTTTTAGCTQFMLTLVAADCPTACADISYDFAVESPSAVLALNSMLYIPGECGVTPIAAGYYADGNHCYQVDGTGKVIGRSSCV